MQPKDSDNAMVKLIYTASTVVHTQCILCPTKNTCLISLGHVSVYRYMYYGTSVKHRSIPSQLDYEYRVKITLDLTKPRL